jgi:hypothetical protein
VSPEPRGLTRGRVLMLLIAAAWMMLGLLSSATPGLPYHVWVALGCLGAGSAVKVAHHRTSSALRTHFGFVTLYGALRVWHLVHVGRVASIAVWAIISLQAGLVWHLVDRREKGK